MQDKIQEIVGLVETYGEACENYGKHRKVDAYQAVENYRHLIEAALRKLVREPLSHKEACELIAECEQDGPIYILRNTELAHNITNTSEKQ